MSFLKEIPLDEESFQPFALAKASFGFIPNFYRAQTLRPDLVEAETNLVGTILIKEGALSRTQKEYVFLVCSAANLSTYCVTAHCEIVRMLGLKGPEPEQIAVDHANTDIPMSDKMLLDFVLRLNRDPLSISRPDIEGLRTYGFSDEQILEAVVLTGLARFANLIAAGLGAHPDFKSKVLGLKQAG